MTWSDCHNINRFVFLFLTFFCVCFLPKARAEKVHNTALRKIIWQQDTIPAPTRIGQIQLDSIDAVLDSLQQVQDSLANSPYSPSVLPTYRPKDRFGDPFSNFTSASPLLLKDPSTLKMDVEIDTGMNYTVYEKIGDLNYRPTTSMSFEEFNQYQSGKVLKEYWKNRSAGLDGESAVSGRNLIPPIYISPVFDKIFGGSYVEINPRGFVTLDFGGRWQRIDNPSLPIRQQRNGGFEFDQLINMSVVGKIGEKLEVEAVLTGTTQVENGKVRVNLQLISVRKRSPLWTDRLEQEFSDVFSLQDDISKRIAYKLGLESEEKD